MWQKIDNLDSYDSEFNRIVSSIYGHSEKPALGSPPSYTQTVVDTLPGLTKVDSLITKWSCERAIEEGFYFIVIKDVWEKAETAGIPLVQFNDSLEILHRRRYITTDIETIGMPEESPSTCEIGIYGFEQYAKAYVDDYEQIKESVAFYVVNHAQTNQVTKDEIPIALRQPSMMVHHILKVLEQRDLIQIVEASEGEIWVVGVSVELKRMLSG